MKKTIIKLQFPLFASNGECAILVYNKDESINTFLSPEEVREALDDVNRKELDKLVQENLDDYYDTKDEALAEAVHEGVFHHETKIYCECEYDLKTDKLKILHPVQEQDW